ncbi:MAG: dienelactone hydrolase family protein, partial [Rhodospirillales bacterium]|nr:dienelactone hydrolase family protein [Rhodospirillales bacterium]
MLKRIAAFAILAAGLALPQTGAAIADNQFPFPYNKTKAFPPPLKHPTEASTKVEGRLSSQLFKPEGGGPFPVVILHHTCAGVSEHIRQWAKEAVDRGFVAYVIDSFGPRNVYNACGKVTDVLLSDGMVDVLDGARHLAKLPFVDPKRIVHIGFSWGGSISLFGNSTWVRNEPKFTA